MKNPLSCTDDENPPVGKDRVLSIFDNRFILFSVLFSTFDNGFTEIKNPSVGGRTSSRRIRRSLINI